MAIPDKIYLGIGPISGDKPNEKYLYAEWDEEPRPMVKNIEYVRKDVFIEKAVEWLTNTKLFVGSYAVVEAFKRDMENS